MTVSLNKPVAGSQNWDVPVNENWNTIESTLNSQETAIGSKAAAEPPGTIRGNAGSTIPAGWLNCNGAAISRTTYADLFAAIGTTYGAGNGSTTFNLPNIKLVGGTLKVLGNGKSLGLSDGTNNGGLQAVAYMDVHVSALTGCYNVNTGAASSGSGLATGKAFGVVTSGESGLVLSPTQTVKAIIKY